MEKLIKLEFVGHCNVQSKLARKSERFLIGITQGEFLRIKQFPLPRMMTATVLDGNGIHITGREMDFVNPFFEFQDSMSPTFMRVLV
jgi:hypothetical protein